MLSSVIAAHLFNKAPKETKVILQNAFKIVSREHLNELGKDLNLIRFIDSKVPIQHFGENIHGNILNL
jgi:ribonuclease-3